MPAGMMRGGQERGGQRFVAAGMGQGMGDRGPSSKIRSASAAAGSGVSSTCTCTCTLRQHRTFRALAQSNPRAGSAGLVSMDTDARAHTSLCRPEWEDRAQAGWMSCGCRPCEVGSVNLLAIDRGPG